MIASKLLACLPLPDSKFASGLHISKIILKIILSKILLHISKIISLDISTAYMLSNQVRNE